MTVNADAPRTGPLFASKPRTDVTRAPSSLRRSGGEDAASAFERVAAALAEPSAMTDGAAAPSGVPAFLGRVWTPSNAAPTKTLRVRTMAAFELPAPDGVSGADAIRAIRGLGVRVELPAFDDSATPAQVVHTAIDHVSFEAPNDVTATATVEFELQVTPGFDARDLATHIEAQHGELDTSGLPPEWAMQAVWVGDLTEPALRES